MVMASAKRRRMVSWRPRNISVPSYRPTQRDGCTSGVRQLVPGSGEGQHTGTVDDYHRVERKEAHALRSPSLLVTISYYSIPAGMLGRGPHTLSTQWSRLPPASASLRSALASGSGSPRALDCPTGFCLGVTRPCQEADVREADVCPVQPGWHSAAQGVEAAGGPMRPAPGHSARPSVKIGGR